MSKIQVRGSYQGDSYHGFGEIMKALYRKFIKKIDQFSALIPMRFF